MVEGLACFACANDGADDQVQVGQNVASWNANGAKAKGDEVRVTRLIARRPVASVVNFAVGLDCQPYREACEIETVRPDRMLPTELEAAGAGAERSPQEHFG
jgi:O-methyltransferase involved in polyketide biosynthesis